MTRSAVRRGALAGLLAALVAATWAGGLRGAFVADDWTEIVDNPAVRTLERWGAVLGATRPVVVLTWAVDWRLWGPDPLGFHVVNVVVHGVNAILALLVGEEVFRRLGARRPHLPAVAAAALWAVHPMTTEAVTHLAGRSQALAATFCLGAVLAWLRWRREGGPVHLALSLLSFLAGLATGEAALAVPLLLLLGELVLPGGRTRAALPWLLPHAVVVGVVVAVRCAVRGGATVPLLPLHEHWPTQAEVALRYLGLWLLPVGQTAFHDVPPVTDPLGARSLAALALLGLGTALAVRVGRRRPWVAFAAGWFGLLLVPSGLLPLPRVMAEHRAYLAGWAVCAGAVALLAPAGGRWPRVAGLLAAAAVAALGSATAARNAVWRSEVTLNQEATRRAPGSAEAWLALGDALDRSGDASGAEAAYRTAIRLDGDRLEAWNALGLVRMRAGRSEEARSAWMQALRRHPTACDTHGHLGRLHVRERSWSAAAAEFRAALDWCPGDVQAHAALGDLYWAPLADPARAAWHYQRVLALDPEAAEALLARERLLTLTRPSGR